jgi:hypothetical protein
MTNRISSIPSARRLITSLRDLGYGLTDAVAEIVDNSIEAGANFVQLKIVFDGEDSYLLVMDNGRGMTPPEIQEAMRFGSAREYDAEDLGRFGLGLKTASLSQCDELIVSSRQGTQRARINSFMWSMDHITKADRWEILKVPSEDLPPEVFDHLGNTVGTVICWRRLSRLMGYRWPTGKHAEQEADRMVSELKLGLGATFHRFLSGELGRKRTGIFVNGEPVEPWDPFCRSHPKTDVLPPFEVQVATGDRTGKLVFRPFLLPATKSFASPSELIKAGGLKKWNKQQGFYIYRAGRLLQSGGWSGLRTADEHTKLVRVLVDIPPGMDEAFKVNISKMRVSIPREIRATVLECLASVIKAGQEKYRSAGDGTVTQVTFGLDKDQLQVFAAEFGFEAAQLERFVLAVGDAMSPMERRMFLSGLRRYVRQSAETTSSEQIVA